MQNVPWLARAPVAFVGVERLVRPEAWPVSHPVHEMAIVGAERMDCLQRIYLLVAIVLVLEGRMIEALLDKLLSFGVADNRLQLGGGEGVDEARFRYDEKQDFCSCQRRKLVCL